jgi:antitoxin VapB
MRTAAAFKSGNLQAVRLPRHFQFDVSEVEIFRRGDDVLLRRLPTSLLSAFDLLAALPQDFMNDGREDSLRQARDTL